MSNFAKKIVFAVSVVLPFLLYGTYYYGIMIKNAPYKFSEFDALIFEYRYDLHKVHRYHSKQANYQYINKNGVLINRALKLSEDDLLHLHRKAAALGFWSFPARLINRGVKNKVRAYYLIEFNYKRKSKRILFDTAFDGDLKLKNAVLCLIQEIHKTLSDSEYISNRARHS